MEKYHAADNVSRIFLLRHNGFEWLRCILTTSHESENQLSREMKTVIRHWALLPFFGMAGCTNFSALRQDFQESGTQLGRVAGETRSASCPDCPIVPVALEKPDSTHVHTYRVYERAGGFSLVIPGVSRYLFAFNDLNDDFQFQDDEPHAWLACRKALAPVDDVTCSRAAKGATTTTRISKYASVMVAAPFWNKCSIEQQSPNNADAEHPPKTKRNPLKK
ncbi:MAG: hypothetical protein MK097_05015 [Dechloromonas sp.]|nr:hypothetical protein [Dechloromonas sp.]